MSASKTKPAAAATSEALPPRPKAADLDELCDRLTALGLTFAAEGLPELLTKAVKVDQGAPGLLRGLLESEQTSREERRIRTALRLSGLPTGQTISKPSTSRSSRRLSGATSMRWPPARG